jgi:hypothetical protein
LYRVQALTVYAQGEVGGGLSQSVAATPVDQTPPAPPVDVKAARFGAGVKIFWSPVQDDDVNGYRVYRRQSDGGTVLIGEVSIPYTLYEDKSAPTGSARLFYSVSSIDRSDPPNESVKSPEAMIKR